MVPEPLRDRLLWWGGLALGAVSSALSAVALVVMVSLLGVSGAHATTWYLNEHESGTVGASVGSSHNGPYYFEYWCPGPVTCGGETATYQNSVSRPGGGKYVRFFYYEGQHDYEGNGENGSGSFGATAFSDLSPATITAGTTVYLATFVRFDRIGGVDLWDDGFEANDFDKWFGVRSGEIGDGLRWYVTAGWANSGAAGPYPGKFTFQLTKSPNYCPSCNWGPDELRQNAGGYDYNNAYLCDYERWYAVVLGLTIQANSSGRTQLWINGTQVMDYAGRTVEVTPTNVAQLVFNTTYGQPNYSGPSHYRYHDGEVFTDDLTFLQNNGYFADPEAGGLLPGPTIFRIPR